MTEAYRLECEIREHLRRVSAKGEMGRAWWTNIMRPMLVKHRGEEATQNICDLMNEARKK